MSGTTTTPAATPATSAGATLADAKLADELRDAAGVFGQNTPGFVYTMSADEAGRVAALAVAAAPLSAGRPVLSGVALELADGAATMAVTDSYRLAVRTFTPAGMIPGPRNGFSTGSGYVRLADDDAGKIRPALVDARELAAALKSAAKTDAAKSPIGRVAVFVPDRPKSASVREYPVIVGIVGETGTPFNDGFGTMRASVAQYDGAFPDWRRLIPGRPTWADVAFGIPDAEGHVDRARTFGADYLAALELPAEDRERRLAELARMARRLADIPEREHDAAAVVGFNPGYLADVAKLIGTTARQRSGAVLETLTASPRKPALFRVAGVAGERSELTYLLMPIRLPDSAGK